MRPVATTAAIRSMNPVHSVSLTEAANGSSSWSIRQH
jgi:hypothetical protein